MNMLAKSLAEPVCHEFRGCLDECATAHVL